MAWDDDIPWMPTGSDDPSYDPSSIWNTGGGDPNPGQYLPPGEGGGPGGAAGPGGDAPGSTGPQFDWDAFKRDGAGYLSKLLGAGGGGLASLLKSLGLGGKDGSLDIGSLLGLFTVLGGGLNQGNAVNKASKELEAATAKNNEIALGYHNQNQALYKPFIDAGTSALTQLGQPTERLADKFHSQGGPSNMASKFKSAGSSVASLTRR